MRLANRVSSLSSSPTMAVMEDAARLTVRLLLQTALEAEVDAFLGRARYQRRTEEHRAGSRNGWQPPTAVKTTMGPVEWPRPKLRATDQASEAKRIGALASSAQDSFLMILPHKVQADPNISTE